MYRTIILSVVFYGCETTLILPIVFMGVKLGHSH